MNKREEINNPDSCLSKAADDEPVFVLRAQDKLAPILIDLWATLAVERGLPDEKALEARGQALKMRNWFPRKYPD